MRKLIEQRHVIRQNLLGIIAFSLFCYFSYHAVMGERSYLRLLSLQSQIEHLSADYKELREERMALENRVKKMRPGSLDRDLLEERVRIVLGYYHPDERIFIDTK